MSKKRERVNSNIKVNYPTSANNRQIWGTL